MGNIMCASRKRAPKLALSMDLLSFPYLLNGVNVTLTDHSKHNTGPVGSSIGKKKYLHDEIATGAKHAIRPGGAGLGSAFGRIDKDDQINTSKGKLNGNDGVRPLLSRKKSQELFLRWNPFCSPWPLCLHPDSGHVSQ